MAWRRWLQKRGPPCFLFSAVLLTVNGMILPYICNMSLRDTSEIKKNEDNARDKVYKGEGVSFHFKAAPLTVVTPKDNPLTKKVVQKSGFQLAEIVLSRCQNRTNTIDSRFKARYSFLFQRMHLLPNEKALYCPVEKVGTTFWRKVIFQINNRDVVHHPFQVAISQALSQNYDFPNENETHEDYGDFFKFLFVRDPYQRLLSAYIDKVFAPNPMFWHRFGRQAIKRFRRNDTRQCYHDATFSEFVQFVVWSLRTKRQLDPHTFLASEMCLPCLVPYDFIGKLELLAVDYEPVFKKLNLEQAIPVLRTHGKTFGDLDAIEDSVLSPYMWQNEILTCMTWKDALQRTWRKLQMRGIIDINIKFPLEQDDISVLRKEDIIDRSKEAWQQSDPWQLKKQKEHVFVSMYRTVPMYALEELRNLYEDDFRLFDYDPSPRTLFDRTNDILYRDYENFRE